MASQTKSYLEHVALRVDDIHWHIRFFRDAFAIDIPACDGPTDNPRQI